jgi:hypothetical protein
MQTPHILHYDKEVTKRIESVDPRLGTNGWGHHRAGSCHQDFPLES